MTTRTSTWRVPITPARRCRPHVPEESQVLGLDQMRLGALVATARASSPDDAALITLLGLRVSEACHVNIEDMGSTPHVIGKDNKPALIPLPVPVARTLDQAAGERVSGPLIRTRSGQRMDRNAATRIVHRLAKRAGIEHRVPAATPCGTPTSLPR